MNRNELSEKLLKYMKGRRYAPMTLPELGAALGLERKDMNLLRSIAAEMLQSGTVAKVKNDRYAVSKDLDLASGIIEFRQSGWATLRSETGEIIGEISPEDTSVALNGDKVLARTQHRRLSSRERFRSGANSKDSRRSNSTPVSSKMLSPKLTAGAKLPAGARW